MNSRIIPFIALSLGWSPLLAIGQQPALRELSDAEADALILEREEARQQREADRLINRVAFTVLDRKEITLGERKLIMTRVVPPVLVNQADQVAVPGNSLSAISLTGVESGPQNREQKDHRAVIISATVYDRQWTELRWHHQGEAFVAYSNIDFNFLRSVTHFETATASYFFIMAIANMPGTGVPEHPDKGRPQEVTRPDLPAIPAFTPGRAEYAVLSADPSIIERNEVFDPIDALHAWFEQREPSLRIEYQRTQAINEAQKRHEARYPKEPPDTRIHFWPVRGSVYQQQPEH